MVDAEWLLKSHRELLGVEKALQRRIKQLKMDDNENDVIESMELGTIQEAGMPRAQSRFGSKTERQATFARRRRKKGLRHRNRSSFWRKSSERCGRT